MRLTSWLGRLLLSTALVGAFTGPGVAQITRDGTLGQGVGPLAGPNFQIGADIGRQVGGNLFHSFGQFNVNTGESATFSGPGSVANVIGRVTGGNATNIDGTLRSTIPGANLFLINPSGMAFGPNARLDVQGAFHASTADYLGFADGARFDAKTPAASTLTVAEPSAFGFLTANPATLTVSGAQLGTPSGKSLSIVAGNVTIGGNSQVTAPGGTLQVAASGGAGEIPVDPLGQQPTSVTRFGTVTIVGASRLDAGDPSPSGRGGEVRIRGGQILVDGATIATRNSGFQTGGGIALQASEALTLRGGASVASTASGTGRGGGITLAAPSVSLSGGTVSTDTTGSAQAANVTVEAGRLEITSGGGISSGVFSTGTGGDITVRASDSILISRDGAISLTGIAAQSAGLTGQESGNVVIETARLELVSGGVIVSNTTGAARGGNIQITASNSVDVSGRGAAESTGIFAIGFAASTGNVGGITIDTARLAVGAGSSIIASTFGAGRGGDIRIAARDRVEVDGGGEPTQIIVSTLRNSTGDAGSISVDTGTLVLKSGGAILADTGGAGRGGNVVVSAREAIVIDGRGTDAFTGLSADAVDGTGHAGNVTAEANVITVSAGGAISSETSSAGRGGDVSVTARQRLEMDGVDGDRVTGITARTNEGSRADAGRITVTAGDITITGGAQILATTSASGRGGDIGVNAGGTIKLLGTDSDGSPSGIFATTNAEFGGQAGTIGVTTGRLIMESGAQIGGGTFGGGRGGDVLILAREAVDINAKGYIDFPTGILADSEIGSRGAAGAVDVVTGSLSLTGNARVSSSTSGAGDGGDIKVNVSGPITIAGGATAAALAIIGADALPQSTGKAGTVSVKAASIVAGDNGFISSSTFGPGAGGTVAVDAGTILLARGGGIASSTLGAGAGGTVSVNADTLMIRSGGKITTSTGGLGPGGTVTVNARSIDLADASSRIAADVVATLGNADAGGVVVNADVIKIAANALMSSSTGGAGKGGNVSVTARERIDIVGGVAPNATGILAQGEPGSTGDSGTIVVEAPVLTINGFGQISSSAFGDGQGGTVTVTADSLSMSGVAAISSSTFGAKPGGTVQVTANSVTLADAATIQSSTFGAGKGGNVVVTARDRIDIVGLPFSEDGPLPFITGIIAQGQGAMLGQPESTGDAGTLTVETSRLSLSGFGQISGSALGQGSGGTISVKADAIILTDGAAIQSSTFGPGRGGSVVVNARDRIDIRGGERTTGIGAGTSPQSTGDAGSVSVETGTLALDGAGVVTSTSLGAGRGGDVSITARELVARGGFTGISAGALGPNDAGTIAITADRITLSDGAAITTQTDRSGGGNVTINVSDQLYLLDSRIATSVRTGSGSGGNITIARPQFVILNNSTILANAFGGNGGNIDVTADFIFSSAESVISASSALGVDGVIIIRAPGVDVTSALVQLSADFLDRATLLRDACAREDRAISSLAPVGRGALPPEPDGAQPGLYLAEQAAPMSAGGAVRLAAVELPSSGLATLRCVR